MWNVFVVIVGKLCVGGWVGWYVGWKVDFGEWVVGVFGWLVVCFELY